MKRTARSKNSVSGCCSAEFIEARNYNYNIAIGSKVDQYSDKRDEGQLIRANDL